MRRVSEADQEVMLRLRRWMHNIVTACGVAVDDRNAHVGLHQALVFADPQHPEFEGLLARVAPFLPTEVRRDFEKLRETKRALDQEKWLESSINRFRDIVSPLTAELFAPRPHSLSMLDIIRDGGHVLASLQELRDFSHDEKQVIGGLLIDEVLCAKQAEEELTEEQRVPFILGIDEFGEFLGEDLLRAFGAVRKYKLSIIVASQDLSTLEKGELDLAAKVLTQCHTKLIFNMTWPDDLDVLSRNVGYGNILFDELIHEIERHGGYDFFRVIEPSLSFQQGRNHSDGGARGHRRRRDVADAPGVLPGELGAGGDAHRDAGQRPGRRGEQRGEQRRGHQRDAGHPRRRFTRAIPGPQHPGRQRPRHRGQPDVADLSW